MTYRIIQNRKIFLGISLTLVITAIVLLIKFGLNFGIDFTGGSLMEVQFSKHQPSIEEIQKSLDGSGVDNLIIQPTNNNSVILRFKTVDEEQHQKIFNSVKSLAKDGEEIKELKFDSIGPSIGQELKNKSFNMSLIVLLMIILYISFAFRKVSKPVASWKYGTIAIMALIHDVLITLGVFAVLGHYYGIEINTPFIAAILTVLGYSVSDTIVVFDRVRENLPKSNEDFEHTINRSVNQTISRSVNTSFSAILTLLSILFFGGDTVKDFALALTIGIFIGTYSSIFVASPLLVVWNKLAKK